MDENCKYMRNGTVRRNGLLVEYTFCKVIIFIKWKFRQIYYNNENSYLLKCFCEGQ